MSTLWDFFDLVLTVVVVIAVFVFELAKAHPVAAVVAGLSFLRLFGTTIQSGQKGVLFVFGRARRELEPGFHPLFPIVMTARKTPVRSVTLDLPRQRVTSDDGLVYDVQANIVYRVADPKLALTQVANLSHGIKAQLALIAEDLVRSKTRAGVLDFKTLETELSARAEEKLARWGVTVEQAGFKSIAPTRKSLRLTQLAMLTAERRRALELLVAHGVPVNATVAMLGADRRLVSHARARYHALHRPDRLAPAAPELLQTVPLLPGEEAPAQPVSPTPAVEQEEGVASQMAEKSREGEGTPAPPSPKKTTKGVQPRSWLRLQRRLKLPRSQELPTAKAALLMIGQDPSNVVSG